MKTIKRILCLLIVLIMALGMLTITSADDDTPTSSSDFTDAEDINFTTEVDISAGLGIFRGNPDGSFAPQRIVTRAESCALIARMMLGPDKADKLAGRTTGFPDVDGVSGLGYAIGAIAYCATEGIVVGFPDGKFYPNEPVTAIQFAIMLLRALGYDQHNEFIGNFWQVNAYLAATSMLSGGREVIPIFEGLEDVPYTDGAIREHIAVYLFNALRRYFVTLDSKGNYIINPNASTLGELIFELRKVDIFSNEYRLPGYVWMSRDKVVSPAILNADLIISSGVASKTSPSRGYLKAFKWEEEISLAINGTDTPSIVDAEDVFFNPMEEMGISPFEEGTRYYLIDMDADGQIDTVIIIYELLGRVVSVDYTTKMVQVEVYPPKPASDPARDPVLIPHDVQATGVQVDDYVRVLPKGLVKRDLGAISVHDFSINDPPLSVTAARNVLGRVTAYRHADDDVTVSIITMSGRTYSVFAPGIGLGYQQNPTNKDFDVNTRIYFDANNAVLGYVTEGAPHVPNIIKELSYVYVTGASGVAGLASGSFIYQSGLAVVELVFTDGTTGSFKLPLNDAQTHAIVYERDGSERGEPISSSMSISGWFSYSMIAENTIGLVEVDLGYIATPLSMTSITQGPNSYNFTIGGVTGSRRGSIRTELQIAHGGTVENYVGFTNFPGFTKSTTYTAVDSGPVSDQRFVLVIFDKAPSDPTAQIDLIYVVERQEPEPPFDYAIVTSVGNIVPGGRYYDFMTIEGPRSGVLISPTTSLPTLAVNRVYKLITVDDGKITAEEAPWSAPTSAGTPYKAVDVAVGSVLELEGGTVALFAKQYMIYDASKNGNGRLDKGDKVLWVLNADGEIAVVVITD